jgi:hypothetical protein
MRRRLILLGTLTALTVLLAACTQSGTNPPPSTKLNLATFPKASVVIGQANFTSTATATNATTFDTVYGDPAVVNGVFYAPVYNEGRVMGYRNGIPAANGAAADFVLGQPDFTSANFVAAANGMSGPQTVTEGNGRLFNVDYDYNRVLIWNTPPTTTQAPADVVVGQPDFTTTSADCTAAEFDGPESIFTTDSKLIVADTANNRVLIFNALPTGNAATADLVLGQNSFTTCTENDDNQDTVADGAPTARTLYEPSDVWTDGTKLIVADDGNNRVLIWNSFPTSNFDPADVVVGQTSMTTNTSGASASQFGDPYFLTSNGQQLFVADWSNSRVLVFDGIPTSNGAAATTVLGQADFTHSACNDDNQDGAADSQPSARTLCYPSGLLATSDALVVADHDNQRMLVFKP